MLCYFFLYRTVLLFEHSDVVVLAGLGVLFHSGGTGPSKVPYYFYSQHLKMYRGSNSTENGLNRALHCKKKNFWLPIEISDLNLYSDIKL